MTDQRETDAPTRKSTARHLIEITFVLAMVALAVSVFTGSSKAYEPYNQGTGTILVDSAVCFSSEINSDVIQLLKAYQEVVDAVDDFDLGVGPALSEDDILFGTSLEENNLCAVMAGSYSVLVLRQAEGHVLFMFPDIGEPYPPFIAAKIDALFDTEI